jgi:biotin carboxylase
MRSEAPRSVLILGGGIMQLPAVRIARRRGFRVAVAAAQIMGPIQELAEECLAVDVSDREAVERAARGIARRAGLHGVFTAGTDFSTTVAWVAERLGLPGIPYEAALRATDKARMRAAFSAAGVPSPRFFTASSPGAGGATEQTAPAAGPMPVAAAALGSLPSGFTFPLVVKPVDNMGARGVRRVDGGQELAQALEAALAQSRTRRAIVEEFLEGPELSLDAVVWRGQASVCGVADRDIRFPPFFVEMGHTMPSGLQPELLRAAEQAFVAGIRALGIHDGAAKGDIKITPRGPAVGEIAARLSGGYMSGWTYPLSSGVEVTEAALNVALGLPPGDLRPRRRQVSAERAFISIPGRVLSVEGVEEARRGEHIEELFLRVVPGQAVELPINNMGKAGNVISCAPERQQAVEAAETAARRVFVRLAPGEERTEAFLAGRFQGGFAAFAPAPGHEPQGLRRALAALPPYLGSPARASRGVQGVAVLVPPVVAAELSLRDWHGEELGAAARRVAELTGVRLATEAPAGALALGGVFWKALLKGGVQGGVYLLETLVKAGRAGGAERLLQRWSAWPG